MCRWQLQLQLLSLLALLAATAAAAVVVGIVVDVVGHEKGQTPENEHDGSFSGVVGGSGCQGGVNLPKTSCHTRFQGVVGSGRLKALLKLNKN